MHSWSFWARCVTALSVACAVAGTTAACQESQPTHETHVPASQSRPAAASTPTALAELVAPPVIAALAPTPPTDPRVTWIGEALSIQALRLGETLAPGREVAQFTAPMLTAQEATAAVSDPANGSRIGGVVVLALGTFDQVTAPELSDLLDQLGPQRRVVLVGPGTQSQDVPWAAEVNALYRSAAAARGFTYYVDWQSEVDRDRNLLDRNGITFPEAGPGCKAWVAAINAVIAAIYEGRQ